MILKRWAGRHSRENFMLTYGKAELFPHIGRQSRESLTGGLRRGSDLSFLVFYASITVILFISEALFLGR
jgi:hypothetical protein